MGNRSATRRSDRGDAVAGSTAVGERHVPARTCVACRTRRDKAELVRLVRAPDGTVSVDLTGSLEGRGAYICAERDCWEDALKRSALQRALRTSLPNEVRTLMEQGDVAAIRATTTHRAPSMITGGAHGT